MAPVQLKRCVDCVKEGVTTNRPLAVYKRGKSAGKLVPGPRCATHYRAKRYDRRSYTHEKHIGDQYGITAAEYQAIYDFQGGRCAICRKGNGTTKRLSVDHDHATGVVRGLLDQKCNRDVLGHFNDDVEALQRAIDYLNSPPAVEVLGRRVVPLTGAPVRLTYPPS